MKLTDVFFAVSQTNILLSKNLASLVCFFFLWQIDIGYFTPSCKFTTQLQHACVNIQTPEMGPIDCGMWRWAGTQCKCLPEAIPPESYSP